MPRLLLNVSKDGDSTAPLLILCRCSVTLTVFPSWLYGQTWKPLLSIQTIWDAQLWGWEWVENFPASLCLFFYTKFVSMGVSVCSEICMWMCSAVEASWEQLEHIYTTVYMKDGINIPMMSPSGLGGLLDNEDLVKAANGVQDAIHLTERRCLILHCFGWISAD